MYIVKEVTNWVAAVQGEWEPQSVAGYRRLEVQGQ